MSKIIRTVEHIIDRTPSFDRYLSDLAHTDTNRLSEHDRLIVENHGLAVAIVMQYGHQVQRIEDLMGAAMLGLCIAAERFDPSKGCSFSTYAPQWIRKMVSEQIALDTHTIHVPSRMQQLRNRVAREQERFFAANGYDTTPEQVAAALDKDPEAIQSVWLPFDFATSLSRSIGSDDDDSYTLADTIAETTDWGQSPNGSFSHHTEIDEEEYIHLQVEHILRSLSPRDRAIIEGIHFHGKDFRQLSRELGLTATRLRQIYRSICPF